MSTVLYPGSFDPLHNGHLELIETAAALFGRVVVAVTGNPQKTAPMFDVEERVAMVAESAASVPGLEVTSFAGLVVDLAQRVGADFVVKGVRSATDLDVELQMAQTNLAVAGVHTVLLPAPARFSFVASRFVREIAAAGGDVTALVPPPVAARLAARANGATAALGSGAAR